MAFRGFVWVCLLLSLVASPAARAATPSPAVQGPPATPMRFQRVMLDDPRCEPDCPEWIAAEGKIEIGTGAIFDRFVAGLGGRKLPVLINSPGGSVPDAVQMGRVIRSRKMVVAVAHTALLPCAPRACGGEPRAVAEAWRAICASACPFVLAGGVERYVGPASGVGVHRPWRVLTMTKIYRSYRVEYRVENGRREEISRTLTGERRTSSTTTQAMTSSDEGQYSAYLTEMGVDSSLMTIMEATPSESITWLSPDQLKSTHLVTMRSDIRFPVRADHGNGLWGDPYDGAQHRPEVEAWITRRWPGGKYSLDARFSHLPGGGRVEAKIILHPDEYMPGGPNGNDGALVLAMPPVKRDFRLPETPYGLYRKTSLPLDYFCALTRGARLVLRPEGSDAPRLETEITFTAKDDSDLAPLLAEACPGVVLR